WRTPDQAGQAAFEQQDYQGAAQAFQDPNWRAAARYRAGDFAGASEDLKNKDNALAHYNRGNALARQGQLQEALAAYDAALKLAPADADAHYNRELVAKALKDQEQAPPQGDQQSEQDKKQDKQSKSDRSEDQQSGGEKDGQSDEDMSGATNAGGGERSKDQQRDDKANEDANASGKSRQQSEQAPSKEEVEPEDTAEEAAKPGDKDQDVAGEAERKQATEQWLNQIRDDPAALLRRKFKYQYDQVYGGKDSETNPW
ncbi:unnamed protein product, partial [Phaeothamnion confervicola]